MMKSSISKKIKALKSVSTHGTGKESDSQQRIAKATMLLASTRAQYLANLERTRKQLTSDEVGVLAGPIARQH